MAANRKFLQIAGSTLAKIQALTGENAVKEREILLATDTGTLIVGMGSGTFKQIGSVPKGTTTQRNAATPVDGQLYLDTTEVMLYRGNGESWEKCVDVIPTVKNPTAGDLVKVAADGTLVDSGHAEADVQFKLASSTTGDILTANANGFMADSGVAVADVQTKVAAAVDGNVATFDENGFVEDSGIAAADIQAKVANAVEDNLATFDNSGFVQDSGVAVADVQTKVASATDGHVASFDENGFVEDSSVAVADVQTKLSTFTQGDMLAADANGFMADSGIATANIMQKVASATANNVANLNASGEVVDSGIASADLQQKLASATAGDILTATAQGFMQDSGTALADVQLKLSGHTEGDILTVTSTGFMADSGRSFNDSGSTVNDIWSGAKITEYVTDSISGMSWQAPVKSKSYVPAGSPAEGDRYLVIATATGAWEGKEGYIAEWDGEAWQFTAPVDGMAVFLEDTDHQMAFNGTDWVDISAGFTYTAGNGLQLVNNEFSAVAKTNGGIAIDNTGIAADVDTTSIVLDSNGKISAKVKANDALNVDSTNGLNVAIDGSAIVLDSNNALTVQDLDFGTW